MARVKVQNIPYSLQFNGTSSYMTLPVVPDITGFCFSLWLNYGIVSSKSLIGWSNNSTPSQGFRLVTENNSDNVYVAVSNSGGTKYLNAGSKKLRNKWVNVIFTHVQGSQRIYVNGELIDTDIATMVDATGQTLTIGRNSYSTSEYFSGSMSNIVFHNTTTPWTQEQITALYQNGTIPSGATAVHPLTEGSGTTATDTSGNSNHGTITNGTWSTDTPSKLRTAATSRVAVQDIKASLKFDGVSSNVAGTLSEALTTTHTIMCWLKQDKLSGTSAACLFYSLGGIELITHKIGSSIFTSVYGTNWVDGTQINTNKWYHLAVTRNGTAANGYKVYLNGALVITTTRPDGGTSTAFNIGSNGTSNFFPGSVSNLCAKNGVATQAEIVAHMNGTNPTGALGIWKLDEGAGTTTTDTSGNGNHGTITAGTYTADVPTKKRQQVGGNLVYNGDFEYAPPTNVAYESTTARWIDGSAGGSTAVTPFRWYQWTGAGSPSVLFDSSEKNAGRYSLKLSTKGTGSLVEVSNVSAGTADGMVIAIRILPNTSYTYSYWMKTNYVSGDAAGGAAIQFKERNAAGSNVKTTTPTKVKTTTGWTQYTGTFTSSATSLYLCPNPTIVGNDGAGTLIMDAWFDDITLTPTTNTTRTAV